MSVSFLSNINPEKAYAIGGSALIVASVITFIVAANLNAYFVDSVLATTGTALAIAGIMAVIKSALLHKNSKSCPLDACSSTSKVKQLVIATFCLLTAAGALYLSHQLASPTRGISLTIGAASGLYSTFGAILLINLLRKRNVQ